MPGPRARRSVTVRCLLLRSQFRPSSPASRGWCSCLTLVLAVGAPVEAALHGRHERPQRGPSRGPHAFDDGWERGRLRRDRRGPCARTVGRGHVLHQWPLRGGRPPRLAPRTPGAWTWEPPARIWWPSRACSSPASGSRSAATSGCWSRCFERPCWRAAAAALRRLRRAGCSARREQHGLPPHRALRTTTRSTGGPGRRSPGSSHRASRWRQRLPSCLMHCGSRR